MLNDKITVEEFFEDYERTLYHKEEFSELSNQCRFFA